MIPLLDTHQHLIYRKISKYSWTNDIPPLSTEDFTIKNYQELTQGLGVGGSIFMESGVDDSDYKKEAEFTKTLYDDDTNKILGLILSIRPEEDEGFDEWLNKTVEMGAVGYRRILHVMPDDLSRDETFRKNVRKIGSMEKTFDLCFLPSQLKIAKELAVACDNTNLILNHCGVPSIATNGLDPWRNDIEELSKVENVTCKLSGLMAYCAPGTSSIETIQPYVDHVLKCFGPDRIVWGSDWPVVNLGKELPEWINVTRKILDKLSEDEASAIANLNAQKIYRISL